MTADVVRFPVVGRPVPVAEPAAATPHPRRRPAPGFNPEAISEFMEALRAGDPDDADWRARCHVEGRRE